MAKLHNQVLGKSGEDIAALFFKDKGYKIVERNWRCKMGEIDLIVSKKTELRFVEVKTRSNSNFGYPEEALTYIKKRHFFNAIEFYLNKHKLNDAEAHADVIAIILNDKDFDIRWLPDCS